MSSDTRQEVLLAAVCGCPSGLLGKLACVSKELRKACGEEAGLRARASGRDLAPGNPPLPPISVRLLTTAHEVDWAVSCGVWPSSEYFAAALAAGGSVAAVERAIELYPYPYMSPSWCTGAAKGGRLEVLEWLREKGCPWDSCTCSWAAWGGHLEVLKWLRENGCPWDDDMRWWDTCAIANAAKGGHLEVVKWAKENGCPWDSRTCSEAALGGHIEVLKWARENGCPWDSQTCSSAAQGGHLELLKWLRENGCPWDSWTCSSAAQGGHLEVLEWAVENGCPRDEDTCAEAAKGGHLAVLEWAVNRGFRWCHRRSHAGACRCARKLARKAKRAGHRRVADWILRRHQ